MALKHGYNVSNFALRIGDMNAGYLSSFAPPSYEVEDVSQGLGPDWVTKKMLGNAKIGEATASFNISSCQLLLDWVASVWRKECVEHDCAVDLANQNYEVQRSISMTGCLISKIEFPKFDAKDGKKHLELTVGFKPSGLTYDKGSGKLQAPLSMKAKNWMVSNFKVEIPGIKACDYILSFEPPKLTPKIALEAHGAFRLGTQHYASIDVGTIKVEFSSFAFEDVKNMAVKVIQDGVIDESEFMTISCSMYDQSMKKILGTFNFMGCAMKKFDWSPKLEGGKEGMATCTAEFVCEEVALEVMHK